MMETRHGEEQQRCRSSLASAPIRKAISLTAIFRPERSNPPSSFPSAVAGDGTLKRRKRLSLRRPALSAPAWSSMGSGPTSHSPLRSLSSGARGEYVPHSSAPLRPSCPAPLLDLSCDDDDDGGENDGRTDLRLSVERHSDSDGGLPHYHTRILGRLASRCPSQESFQCRGLDCDDREPTKAMVSRMPPPLRPRPRPTILSFAPPPPATKLEPQPSLLSLSSDSPSSPSSSVFSLESSLDENGGPERTTTTYPVTLAGWQRPAVKVCERADDMEWFCPPSPPAKVRLQLTLPPTAHLCSHLILYMHSNSSSLELKETVCATLWERFQFSISPSNVALLVIQVEGEAAKLLENDRPLYQEGLQDDDEVVVRF